MIILVSGGVRSSKSTYAEALINQDKVYIATMRNYDSETNNRIQSHQNRRDDTWTNYEVFTDLKNSPEYNGKEILLDCLTNLVTNELIDGIESDKIIEKVFHAIVEIGKECSKLVIVTNNVFEEVDTYSELTQSFLRVMGAISCKIAAIANKVIECEFGICTNLKEE